MKKLTKKEVKSMALEIIELLCSDDYKDFWSHIAVYAGGNVYSSEPFQGNGKNHWIVNGEKVYISEEIEPNFSSYLPNAKDHILSMTFEGDLSRVIGYDVDMPEFMDKFGSIFQKSSVFFECMESWNLTCYPA